MSPSKDDPLPHSSSPPQPSTSHADASALDQVVRESRTDLKPPKDLGGRRVEQALFARITEERDRVEALDRYRGSARWGWGALGGLAVAAALALLLGRGVPVATPQGAEDGVSPAEFASRDVEASSFVGKEGPGEVLVGRADALAPAGKRTETATGTVIETHGAQGLWKAGDRVTWLVEADSRVAVRQSAPLVLRLERGAIEAQVTPVASGEAFAVDVGDERIAVHGTHLRVAREADRVTVDLSEGVVTIGRPPRTGSTYGTLVVAPAHVQFEIGDLAGSLQVTHEASAVRPAVVLASLTAAAPPSTRTATADATPSSTPRASAAATAAGHGAAAVHRNADTATTTVAVDPHAEETVASAVRACAADAPHSSEVTVTVSSELELAVGDDGFVRAARFSPPLAPEIQRCASTSIYKTHFADPGVHTVDIVLQH